MINRRGELAHPRQQYRKNSLRFESWDYSSPGPYFFTICTFRRKEIFSFEAIRTKVIDIFTGVTDELGINLHAIIVADNHIHALTTLPGDKRVSLWNYIGKAKVRITQAMKSGQASLPLRDKVWQRSFYDHIVRDEHDFLQKASYIESHPAKEEGDIYTEWH